MKIEGDKDKAARALDRDKGVLTKKTSRKVR
jgi:hypothetical protein